MVFSFIFMGAPLGLGATLIVATLIMRRAISARSEIAVPALAPMRVATAPASWRGPAARSQSGVRP